MKSMVVVVSDFGCVREGYFEDARTAKDNASRPYCR